MLSKDIKQNKMPKEKLVNAPNRHHSTSISDLYRTWHPARAENIFFKHPWNIHRDKSYSGLQNKPRHI